MIISSLLIMISSSPFLHQDWLDPGEKSDRPSDSSSIRMFKYCLMDIYSNIVILMMTEERDHDHHGDDDADVTPVGSSRLQITVDG